MLWVVRLPIAWFGAGSIGQEGVWAAFAVSNVVGAGLAWAWFRRGGWKRGDATDDFFGVDVGPDPEPTDD